MLSLSTKVKSEDKRESVINIDTYEPIFIPETGDKILKDRWALINKYTDEVSCYIPQSEYNRLSEIKEISTKLDVCWR